MITISRSFHFVEFGSTNLQNALIVGLILRIWLDIARKVGRNRQAVFWFRSSLSDAKEALGSSFMFEVTVDTLNNIALGNSQKSIATKTKVVTTVDTYQNIE